MQPKSLLPVQGLRFSSNQQKSSKTDSDASTLFGFSVSGYLKKIRDRKQKQQEEPQVEVADQETMPREPEATRRRDHSNPITREKLNQLEGELMSTIHEAEAESIVRVAEYLHDMDRFTEEFTEIFSDAVAKNLKRFNEKEFQQLMVLLANQKSISNNFRLFSENFILKHLDQFTEDQLSKIVFSCASLGYQSSKLWNGLTSCVEANRHKLDLSHIMTLCSKLNKLPVDVSSLSEICQEELERFWDRIHPSDASSLLFFFNSGTNLSDDLSEKLWTIVLENQSDLEIYDYIKLLRFTSRYQSLLIPETKKLLGQKIVELEFSDLLQALQAILGASRKDLVVEELVEAWNGEPTLFFKATKDETLQFLTLAHKYNLNLNQLEDLLELFISRNLNKLTAAQKLRILYNLKECIDNLKETVLFEALLLPGICGKLHELDSSAYLGLFSILTDIGYMDKEAWRQIAFHAPDVELKTAKQYLLLHSYLQFLAKNGIPVQDVMNVLEERYES